MDKHDWPLLSPASFQRTKGNDRKQAIARAALAARAIGLAMEVAVTRFGANPFSEKS